MSMAWIKSEELLRLVAMSEADLVWYREQFREQFRVLCRQEEGQELFAHDAVNLLRSLSAMRAHGATPEQIKGWFGLA